MHFKGGQGDNNKASKCSFYDMFSKGIIGYSESRIDTSDIVKDSITEPFKF